MKTQYFKKMDKFKELKEKVIDWGKARGLYHPTDGATPESQYLKFLTEIGELADALLKQDDAKIKDAIGDCMVCLIAKLELEGNKHYSEELIEKEIYLYENNHKVFNISHILSINTDFYHSSQSLAMLLVIEKRLGFYYCECLEIAYNEIKDRKGKMINREFIKEV